MSELAKFVIKLSVDFKKSVSIVTSNYDTFIEDSIIKELYIPYAKKKKKKKKEKLPPRTLRTLMST